MPVESLPMTLTFALETDSMSSLAFATTTLVTLKIKEQSGNVVENKGALWKTGERSGNIVENKRLTGQIGECR
jgi:phosphoribosyl-AMP cyclohydrolase